VSQPAALELTRSAASRASGIAAGRYLSSRHEGVHADELHEALNGWTGIAYPSRGPEGPGQAHGPNNGLHADCVDELDRAQIDHNLHPWPDRVAHLVAQGHGGGPIEVARRFTNDVWPATCIGINHGVPFVRGGVGITLALPPAGGTREKPWFHPGSGPDRYCVTVHGHFYDTGGNTAPTTVVHRLLPRRSGQPRPALGCGGEGDGLNPRAKKTGARSRPLPADEIPPVHGLSVR
jgi:hypothetical protein